MNSQMEKKYRHGFSLIEFMVYLIAFSCIITLAFHTLVVVTQKMRSSSKQIHTTMQLLVALDSISFELAQAPHEKNNWHMLEKSCCVWHSNLHKKDIGFYLTDKKVVKTRGVYCPQTKKWLSKVSNIVAENIDDCAFEYESTKNKSIRTLVCTLSTQGRNFTRTISLNNGYAL